MRPRRFTGVRSLTLLALGITVACVGMWFVVAMRGANGVIEGGIKLSVGIVLVFVGVMTCLVPMVLFLDRGMTQVFPPIAPALPWHCYRARGVDDEPRDAVTSARRSAERRWHQWNQVAGSGDMQVAEIPAARMKSGVAIPGEGGRNAAL